MKNKPKTHQEAAWSFVKWAMEPSQVVIWTVVNGYFPINKAATEQDTFEEFINKYPAYQAVLDQLHNTPENRVTHVISL